MECYVRDAQRENEWMEGRIIEYRTILNIAKYCLIQSCIRNLIEKCAHQQHDDTHTHTTHNDREKKCGKWKTTNDTNKNKERQRKTTKDDLRLNESFGKPTQFLFN